MKSHPVRWLLLALGLALVVWIATLPQTPAQQLVGTWQATVPEGRMTLVFEPNGRFVWGFRATSFWARLAGSDFELPGRWQLTGQRLAMAIDPDQTVPPGLALWGIRSEDLAGEQEIVQLTDTDLILQNPLNPSDQTHYQRMPP